MTKKTYIIIAIVTILLYIAAALYSQQVYMMEFGEFFGYMFYVIIIAGVIAAVWLLIKRPKTKTN